MPGFVPRAFRLSGTHMVAGKVVLAAYTGQLAFHLGVGICPYWGGFYPLDWILL